jgi:hypothetical protein
MGGVGTDGVGWGGRMGGGRPVWRLAPIAAPAVMSVDARVVRISE